MSLTTFIEINAFYHLLDCCRDALSARFGECALELANLIKPTFGFVNLIPYNPVKEKPYERSDWQTVKTFQTILMRHGIKTTVRKEFGTDIDAACGQLRARHEKVIK